VRTAITLSVFVLIAACDSRVASTGGSLALSELLADADVNEFDRALAPRRLQFPSDHYVHARFKTEWWYLTGNLDDATGDPFGFQLTFFRFALTPDASHDAGWRSSAVWMGHLAVTDVARAAFYSAERLSRDGLDLAGNARAPFRLWIEDWSAVGTGDEPFPLSVVAADTGVAVMLQLDDDKGPVAQGEQGFDRKGPDPGNASYYYSMPRLRASGQIRVGDIAHRVTGLAWMDREWSSNALDRGLAGWDWLALQLDDGTELMLYRLRTEHGQASPFSTGALIGRDGRVTTLASDAFQMRATAYWTSPATGSRYPTHWSIEVPEHRIVLDLDAAVESQEMNLAVRYWEGAVTATGERGGAAISGRGYLELTGY